MGARGGEVGKGGRAKATSATGCRKQEATERSAQRMGDIVGGGWVGCVYMYIRTDSTRVGRESVWRLLGV